MQREQERTISEPIRFCFGAAHRSGHARNRGRTLRPAGRPSAARCECGSRSLPLVLALKAQGGRGVAGVRWPARLRTVGVSAEGRIPVGSRGCTQPRGLDYCAALLGTGSKAAQARMRRCRSSEPAARNRASEPNLIAVTGAVLSCHDFTRFQPLTE